MGISIHHVCHVLVYHYAKFERHSLINSVRYITINNYQLRDAAVTLGEGQGYCTGSDHIDLQSDYLHSELEVHCLRKIAELIEHLHFVFKVV